MIVSPFDLLPVLGPDSEYVSCVMQFEFDLIHCTKPMVIKFYLFGCPLPCHCLSSIGGGASMLSHLPYRALREVSDLVIGLVLDRIYHPAGQHNSGIISGCRWFCRNFGLSLVTTSHNLAHDGT
jgi:hypothetical protein